MPGVWRGLFAAQTSIGERAFGAVLGSARQHGLELGVGHSHEALGSGWVQQQGIETVVKRKQRVPTEGNNDGLFLLAEKYPSGRPCSYP